MAEKLSFNQLIQSAQSLSRQTRPRTAQPMDNFGGVYSGPVEELLKDESLTDKMALLVTDDTPIAQIAELILKNSNLTPLDFGIEDCPEGEEQQQMLDALCEVKREQATAVLVDATKKTGHYAGTVGNAHIILRGGANLQIFQGVARIIARRQSLINKQNRPTTEAYLFEPRWDEGVKSIMTEALLWLHQQATKAGLDEAADRLTLAIEQTIPQPQQMSLGLHTGTD